MNRCRGKRQNYKTIGTPAKWFRRGILSRNLAIIGRKREAPSILHTRELSFTDDRPIPPEQDAHRYKMRNEGLT